MPTTTLEAFITPQLIRWARERRNLTMSAAAKKMHVNPDKLNDWENSKGHPTFRQAQDLANKLKIPFGYLFLSKPPIESLPLPDLRTIKNETPAQPSPNFLDVLYDAFRKQEWYHEYLEEENTPPIQFVSKFSVKDEPKVIATDITNTLGIDNDLRQMCDNWEQFLLELIRRAEKARILVIRSGIVGSNPLRKLDVNEFRGFAINDNLAPLVFINENDYKTAQIFTIIHELAHLWIGNSGISNLDYRSKKQSNDIDQFCDHVAAEVLVPSDDFLIAWNDFIRVERNLEKLARRYRVSQFVILRRAYDFNKVDTQQFHDLYDKLLERVTPKKKDGGGHYYKLVLSRNSPTLTKSLMAAASEGRVLPTEVSRLLNIRISKLNTLEAFIVFGEVPHA
ncbi:MAG: ImmA/IrrE family metallo-endopeptidase [Dehalococcoidia bacterium]|nr:ImmA/IrrE family metallo-endopeptidase [Dehalococcoidia bacterium]